MATLAYKVITSKIQCKKYGNVLEQLVFSEAKDRNTKADLENMSLSSLY